MNSFDKWIKQRFQQFDLRIKYSTWTNEMSVGLHSFFAQICKDGRVYYGQGISENREIALKKAIIEAIERAVSLPLFKNSNGIAAHTDSTQAIENSRNELLERHCFLDHFYSKRPFVKINRAEFLSPVESDLINKLDLLGAKVSFYQSDECLGGHCYLSIISGQDCSEKVFGGIIGMSYSRDKSHSLSKSLLEATSQFFFQLKSLDKFADQTLENFAKKEIWTFIDHGKLALNLKYWEQIQSIFPVKDSSELNQKKIQVIDSIETEAIELGMEDCPLFAYRSFSKALLHLTPGPSACNANQFGLPHPIC